MGAEYFPKWPRGSAILLGLVLGRSGFIAALIFSFVLRASQRAIRLRLSTLTPGINRQGRSANQIQFVQLIIRHLTEKGVMEAQLLYESPFTDLNDQGISGLFDQDTVQHIVAVLDSLRGRAAA